MKPLDHHALADAVPIRGPGQTFAGNETETGARNAQLQLTARAGLRRAQRASTGKISAGGVVSIGSALRLAAPFMRERTDGRRRPGARLHPDRKSGVRPVSESQYRPPETALSQWEK
jgi:hypothetical protein